jgi:hypothetical protein
VVQMKARPTREPGLHSRMFVRAVVIGDQVHVELFGNTAFNVTQKAQELLMPMPRLALSNDTAIGDIEGGKQRSTAVTDVVMGDAFDIAQAHRQYR